MLEILKDGVFDGIVGQRERELETASLFFSQNYNNNKDIKV
jgi:hypothetical protein